MIYVNDLASTVFTKVDTLEEALDLHGITSMGDFHRIIQNDIWTHFDSDKGTIIVELDRDIATHLMQSALYDVSPKMLLNDRLKEYSKEQLKFLLDTFTPMWLSNQDKYETMVLALGTALYRAKYLETPSNRPIWAS